MTCEHDRPLDIGRLLPELAATTGQWKTAVRQELEVAVERGLASPPCSTRYRLLLRESVSELVSLRHEESGR